MSRAKKEVKELTKIAGILTDIRHHEDAAEELVEELEGIAATNKGTKHRKFCQAYVIVVIREFCSTDDDAELMLAAYGLLKGFEFKPQGMTDRLVRYWRHSRNYNKLLKDINSEASVPRTLGNKIDKIIKYLDKKITARLSGKKKKDENGKLGFLDRVSEKLELPTPRNSKDDPLFPDKLINDSPSHAPKDNMQSELLESQQQSGDESKLVITFIYSKLLKILMFITVGAFVVACILFIWTVIPKGNKNFTASAPKTEDANNDLESQVNEDENTDNNGGYQNDASGNADGNDERQKFQDELMNNVQNRIVNIDEPEKYDIEMIYEKLLVAIINEPVMGDMVARGLRDLRLYGTNQTFGDLVPWLDEFISETDKAMEIPLGQHPRGMERWCVYKKGAGNDVSLSDEYFYYAVSICHFLDSSTIIGVREWESVENWHLIHEGVVNSSRRAERNPEQVTHQALVFQFTDTEGNIRALFGFSTYDLRFIVYDPGQDYE